MDEWIINLEWIEDTFFGRAIRGKFYYKFHGKKESDKIDVYMLSKKHYRSGEPPSINKDNLFVGSVEDEKNVEDAIKKFLKLNDGRLEALEKFGNRISIKR